MFRSLSGERHKLGKLNRVMAVKEKVLKQALGETNNIKPGNISELLSRGRITTSIYNNR